MKDTKTEIRFFSVPQWKKEEEYLRSRHSEGWEFTGVGLIGVYHFRRCEPKDVIYQLDYNDDSIRNREEYIQMFSDCGWEYLQNYVGYSYFRKPVSEMKGDEEEIFCDDDSLVIIPQLFMQAAGVGSTERSILILFLILFILYVAMFISFAVPFIKYYRSVHRD